jgi:ABC-type transport system involved in multi-copper enzyme maturation permease subunit
MDEPNPIWIREMKQAARLVRTPVILAVVTILMTLLMASIGGIMASTSSPAQTGNALFHTYFSIAYFVVTLVGPAVAANAIASEREGRTWEAVLLTGMRPSLIARGKFLAAYTAIGMYIVMLAPVGAIPFLFGGVTAVQVIVAFLYLCVFAGLGVAFGLAISSKLSSLRTAIVVTLLLAFIGSTASYSVFGVALSFAANRVWPGVAEGPPVWLPTAYDRAPFGIEYVVFLIILPIVVVALVAWFLYEVTVANLSTSTDDRSTGLKRWFLVTAVAVTAASMLPRFVAYSASDQLAYFIATGSALLGFFGFCVFLFQGEPLGASRRVQAAWQASNAAPFRRFLGPSVATTVKLVLIVSALSFAAHSVVAMAALISHSAANELPRMLAFGSYALAMSLLIAGLGAYTRARAATPFTARIALAGLLFGITTGPWIVAAIAGILTDRGTSTALMIAAPSPFYVFVMIDQLRGIPKPGFVELGFGCAFGWGVIGLVAAHLARRHCNAIIVKHQAILAEAERRLAEEDDLAAKAPEAEQANATIAAPEDEAEAIAPLADA